MLKHSKQAHTTYITITIIITIIWGILGISQQLETSL